MKSKFYNIFQVTAFIFSAQVGSGMFILPSFLSRGGVNSLIALLFVGAMSMLAISVFADTGLGIKEIIQASFGEKISKIIYGFYWVVSWASTIVLFKEFSNYLGVNGKKALVVETFMFIIVTFINLWKTKYTIIVESVLTLLKVVPFFFLIIAYFFSSSKKIVSYESINIPMIMKCMWCFVGVEVGSIIGKNLNVSTEEKKLGTYFGMIGVIFIYLASTYFCFAISGNESLLDHRSPYIKVLTDSYSFFGLNIEKIIKVFILIVIAGCINSWTISSGYVAKDCANEKILPKIFGLKNKNGVPYMGIFLSSLFVYLVIILMISWDSYYLLIKAIDYSCYFFLIMYGISMYSYAKFFCKGIFKKSIYYIVSVGYISIVFADIFL